MLTRSPLLYALPTLALVASSSAVGVPTVSSRDASQRQVFNPELSAYIQSALKDEGVYGLSATALYANNSANPEFANFGDWSEDGDAVQSETLFFIGSCSKAFLATSMGILIDDFASGKNQTVLPAGVKAFTWETKLHDIIVDGAEWKLPDQFSTERANLRDLLGHVTGLPGHDLYYRAEDDVTDIINRMQYLKQNRELRQKWQYNNAMYIVGAHIVSVYAGKSYTDFVQERIFAPLGMNSSTYFFSKAQPGLNVSQSFSGPRRTQLWSTDDRLSTLIAGAGGILTNAKDMSKWIALLANGGVNPANNQTIIPKDAFDTVTSGYVIDSPKSTLPELSPSGYGAGWGRFSYRGHEVVMHSGGITGFLSFVAFFPNDGVTAFVAINNGRAASLITTIGFKMFDSMLGLPSDLSKLPDPKAPIPLVARADADVPSPNKTIDLSAYAGTYMNPGYGNITFCTPTSTTGDCPAVLANFSSIVPNINSSPGLYASWDRFWTKSAMLVSASGNSWQFSTFNIYPQGFGKNTTAFTDSIFLQPYPTIFDVDGDSVKGFGTFGGFINAVLPDENDESIPVKDRAEVYFSKV